MTNIELRPTAVIEARVFRASPAPRFVPQWVWTALAKRRIPGTGRWENLGEIASSKQGTVTFPLKTA